MPLALLFGSTRRDFQCCLNGVAFHRLEDLCRDVPIRFQSAERDAPVRSVIDLRPAAMISGYPSVRAAVGYMQAFSRNAGSATALLISSGLHDRPSVPCAISYARYRRAIVWLRSNCSQEM